MPETMTYEEWVQKGWQLAQIREAVAWAIGDWIRFGEQHFGEKYAQAVDVLGMNEGTARNLVWVAEHVAPERRRPDLSWSHHAAVAPLEPAAQVEVLAWAAGEQGGEQHTRDDVRQRVAEIRAAVTGKPVEVWVQCPTCGGCGRVKE